MKKARPDARALGLLTASELFRSFGDPAEGLRLKLELLPRLRELSPERHFPATLADAADMLAEAGDFEEARRLGGEALAARRRLGEPSGINHALSNLAAVEFRAGDFVQARRLSEEALALVEEPYVPTNALYSALLAGESASRTGDRRAARHLLLRALGLCRELGQRGIRCAPRVHHEAGDVREDDEWKSGHAAQAVHLGKGVLERDIEEKIPDKNAELILYCGGGFRSALSADNLQRMGYRNVTSMAGGWRAWKEKGFPTQSDGSGGR